MKALILAAGLGTRLKPWTLHHPKALAEVNGKTLLQLTIEYLQAAGIHEVVINVHHFADQVIEALAKNKGWGSRYQISDESELLMDTGGAIMRAAGYGFLDGIDRFLVVNADILTDMSLRDLIQVNLSKEQLATLAVSERASSRQLLFEKESGLLGGWQNTTTGEQRITRQMENPQAKAFSGIHCMDRKIIDLLCAIPDFNGSEPFSIIDAYLFLSRSQKIGFYDHSGAKFMDTGTPGRLVAAGAIFN